MVFTLRANYILINRIIGYVFIVAIIQMLYCYFSSLVSTLFTPPFSAPYIYSSPHHQNLYLKQSYLLVYYNRVCTFDILSGTNELYGNGIK